MQKTKRRENVKFHKLTTNSTILLPAELFDFIFCFLLAFEAREKILENTHRVDILLCVVTYNDRKFLNRHYVIMSLSYWIDATIVEFQFKYFPSFQYLFNFMCSAPKKIDNSIWNLPQRKLNFMKWSIISWK